MLEDIIQNPELFHYNSYEQYYQAKLQKDITLKISNSNNEADYFWRGIHKIDSLGRKEVEVFFDSDKAGEISKKQIDNFQSIISKLKPLISKLESDSSEYLRNDIPLAKILTHLDFRLKGGNQIEVELWTSFDNEHPLIDNEIYHLNLGKIEDWKDIDEKRALEMITEIIENLDNDSILKYNSDALEKRYAKTTGWLIDRIFHNDVLNPEEILTELKKDDRIIL